jgi:hypothetical protein
MDNTDRLTTYGTQDEDKQSKNNLEKLTTYGTQDEDKQNKNNLEKLATYGTQDEDKQNNGQYRLFLFCLSSSCVPDVASLSGLFIFYWFFAFLLIKQQ